MRILVEGFVEFVNEHCHGSPRLATSERPGPDRLVYRIAKR